MRTIDWVDGAIEIIDQTVLPGEVKILRLHTVGELVAAIQSLAVRGAPALGVAGAFGVALAARVHADDPRALALVSRGPQAVLEEACRVRDEEIAASDAMAARGADLLIELCGARPRLLTHCNTGGLAAVTVGTALGVVHELHQRGRLAGVIASETRPLLQGARLTSWELTQWGIEHRMAVDSAGPFLMARGDVDAVILGA